MQCDNMLSSVAGRLLRRGRSRALRFGEVGCFEGRSLAKQRIDRRWLCIIVIGVIINAIAAVALRNEEGFRKFNSVVWRKNRAERYYLVDDLIASNLLIGLTRSEVVSLLGNSDSEDRFILARHTEHGEILFWLDKNGYVTVIQPVGSDYPDSELESTANLWGITPTGWVGKHESFVITHIDPARQWRHCLVYEVDRDRKGAVIGGFVNYLEEEEVLIVDFSHNGRVVNVHRRR